MDPVAPATTSGGSAAPAQQSAKAPAPASQGGVSSVPVVPDHSKAIAAEFGGTARPVEQEPQIELQSAVNDDPANAGHPADNEQPESAQAPAAKAEGEGTPQGQADVDADLEMFNSLQIKGEQPSGEQPNPQETNTGEVPTTDEAFEKAVNPDGKATQEQRVKNAQSLLGRMGKELGDHRKAIADIGQHFEKTDKGIRPKIESLIQFANMVDPDALNSALAEKLGVKIVPLDFDPSKQADTDALDEQAAAKMVIGSDDFTHEDRMAEIDSDPQKKRAFERALRQVERNRENEVFQKQQKTQQEAARAKAENDTKIDLFFGALRKLPYYESDLKPAIKHWQNRIPDVLPLDLRLELLRTLAVASRVPKVMKEREAKIRETTMQDLLQKIQLGEPIGEMPMHVDMSRAPGGQQSGDKMTPKPVQEALAKEFL